MEEHCLFHKSFRESYELWFLESTTPNPTYCAWQRCHALIPSAKGRDSVLCLHCSRWTCTWCKEVEHDGVCQANEKLNSLMRVGKWQACPKCKRVIEKSDGCQNMRCLCGKRFCYGCGSERGEGRREEWCKCPALAFFV